MKRVPHIAGYVQGTTGKKKSAKHYRAMSLETRFTLYRTLHFADGWQKWDIERFPFAKIPLRVEASLKYASHSVHLSVDSEGARKQLALAVMLALKFDPVDAIRFHTKFLTPDFFRDYCTHGTFQTGQVSRASWHFLIPENSNWWL